MRTSLLVFSLLLAFPARAMAFFSVHVVNGGTSSALQNAVDAAADGDTILVHGGQFGAVSLVARSLTLVAEPEQIAQIRGLVVSNVTSQQRCVVAGFDVISQDQTPAVQVMNCAGSVRLEGIHAHSPGNTSGHGAWIGGSSDVAIVRSFLEGAGQHATPGPNLVIDPVGIGMLADSSRVAVYDSMIFGGAGQDGHFINVVYTEAPAGDGGAGLLIQSGASVFLGHCSVSGGSGGSGRSLACVSPCGFGPMAGGNGGTGASVDPTSVVSLFDTMPFGGVGGQAGHGGQCCPQFVWPWGAFGSPGAPVTGPSTVLGGSGASMVCPDAVRELTNLHLAITGQPGDAVFLAFSGSTRWLLDPSVSGVYLFGTPLRRIALGTIPPSGTLTIDVPVASLPAGVDADSKFLQVAVRTGNGPLRLGSPAWLSILDASF